jgi:hypothetical protein
MQWRFVSIGFCALVFVPFVTGQAFGQECPRESSTGPSIPSRVRSLEGKLIFHNDIRGWFELRLDTPQCGNDSVQLVSFKEKVKALETFRGCRIISTGSIDFSPTGYYSANVFQDVAKLESVGKCAMQPPFRDYSGAKPDKQVRAYTVDMHIDYRRGDHPVEFRVEGAGRKLEPWQAYASYDLTGGYVLYGHCAEGFVIDKVYGTPAARPTHSDEPRTSDDMAEFDPESAAVAGKSGLDLGYTCIRDQHQKQ